jgi:hypothetical protein
MALPHCSLLVKGISNASWPLFSKWLSTQVVLPVAALRARTELDVSPCIVPSAAATPSGPGPFVTASVKMTKRLRR